MPKVEMLVATRDNIADRLPGELVDVSEEISKRWVNNKIAKLVEIIQEPPKDQDQDQDKDKDKDKDKAAPKTPAPL